MDILVLGGTRFIGRTFVDIALSREHTLTLFNRGRTDPGRRAAFLAPALEFGQHVIDEVLCWVVVPDRGAQ